MTETIGNRTLAARCRDLADRVGIDRRAWLCLGVLFATTRTTAAARQAPVRTVSPALFTALQAAFSLAATSELAFTAEDFAETIDCLRGAGERDYDERLGSLNGNLDGLTRIVPPWATLGDLLQALIAGAADMAVHGEVQDDWAAFFPQDY